jgi:putrescine transport system permease protein
MIIFSFNESSLVTVWKGFSTKWYGELLLDDHMISAGIISLKVATISSSISIVLGAMAGLVLARFGRFKGHTVFSSMVTAPLVMPEVITALSLLLFFVTVQTVVIGMEKMGWIIAPTWLKERGMPQIIIAHATFSASYVAVVISSRMRELNISIEEAAQDLGATPFKVYMTITLPIILPAILSGWLMGFTMSLDDLVISAFIAGPGSTTLPVVVYSQVRLGVSPKINALATIVIVTVSTCVIIGGYVMTKLEKKRNRDIQMAASGLLDHVH